MRRGNKVLEGKKQVWYINTKKETEIAAYPSKIKVTVNYRQSSLVRVMAAVSLILEDLVAKTNQGNNQYTKLKQIRICNHCYHPPLFCLEGVLLPSERWRVSRQAFRFPVGIMYHKM